MKLHASLAFVQPDCAAARRAHLEEKLTRGAIEAIVEEHGRHAVPIVKGYRLHDRHGRIIGVEIYCPWCGARHTHGAGPHPGDGNGGRASHCTGQSEINSGYIVREVA